MPKLGEKDSWFQEPNFVVLGTKIRGFRNRWIVVSE